MVDEIKFSLTGVDDLSAKLKEISEDIKYRGGRSALRKAAQVIRDSAKQKAKRFNNQKTESKIFENIVERWNGKRFKSTGDLGFRIGVMGGAGGTKKASSFAGLPGGDTRHWRFLEFGTSRQKAQPFMRPAAEENINEVISTFARAYDKAIDRAIKRAKKKGG